MTIHVSPPIVLLAGAVIVALCSLHARRGLRAALIDLALRCTEDDTPARVRALRAQAWYMGLFYFVSVALTTVLILEAVRLWIGA